MAKALGRGRDGAGARAEALGARRSGRGGRAWARHAARDHRGGDQGADARRQADRPALRGPGLLRAQAERCRDILAELAGGGEQHDLIVSRLPLSHLIEEVVAPHRLVAVPIEVKTGPAQRRPPRGPLPEPVTERNPGMLYGLGNLVENAIDFAASKVEVEARWSKDEVTIVIADDGDGLPAACAGTARRALRHHAVAPKPNGGRPPTSMSAWDSASSSPRPCSSGPAPRSSLPTGRCRMAAPWSRCAGRGRNSSMPCRKPPQSASRSARANRINQRHFASIAAIGARNLAEGLKAPSSTASRRRANQKNPSILRELTPWGRGRSR